MKPTRGSVRPRQRGFTLIEAMITLTVLALLATVTIPAFSGMFNRLRLTGVANEVAADLHYGRTEAVRLRAAVRLVPAVDGRGYQLTSGATVLKQVQFGGGLAFAAQETIDFDQLRATATPATLDLRNPAGTVRVNVNALGRVTLCAVGGGVPGYASCA